MTVFHLDVVGVAIATDISCALSAVLLVIKLKKEKLLEKIKISAKEAAKRAAEILKQACRRLFGSGFLLWRNIFCPGLGQHLGPAAIAGSTVAVNFEYFVYYIITAFGQTAATFTGKTMRPKIFRGAKKSRGCACFFRLL